MMQNLIHAGNVVSSRQQLIEDLVSAMRALQRAVDRYDELVASRLGINRSDLRCLDLLHESGRMSAGQLAAGSGLTTGATTRMLDRLERIGYVRRQLDSGDRRRVLVELTPRARRLAAELYGSYEGAAAGLKGYNPEQLRLMHDFLEGGRSMYEQQTARLQAAEKPSPSAK
jgi:DNA-binding MarR family transcriptional regulator